MTTKKETIVLFAGDANDNTEGAKSAYDIGEWVDRWVAEFRCDAVSGTNPTCDITIQHAFNPVSLVEQNVTLASSWMDLAFFPRFQSSGSQVFLSAASQTDFLKALGSKVRAKFNITGTSTPQFSSSRILFHMMGGQ